MTAPSQAARAGAGTPRPGLTTRRYGSSWLLRTYPATISQNGSSSSKFGTAEHAETLASLEHLQRHVTEQSLGALTSLEVHGQAMRDLLEWKSETQSARFAEGAS
jgi:hypothetical protein